MALDFPNTPTVGQVFSIGLETWKWDGAKWEAYSTQTYYLPLTGGTVTGTLTVAGNLNVTGVTVLGPTTGVTPAPGDNTASIATTAFVRTAINTAVVGNYLPLTGGTLTGNLGIGFGVTSVAPLTFANNVTSNPGIANQIVLWGPTVGPPTGYYYGLGVSAGQLNYTVNSATDGHYFHGNNINWGRITQTGMGITGSSSGRGFVAWNGANYTGDYISIFDDGNAHVESAGAMWIKGNGGAGDGLNIRTVTNIGASSPYALRIHNGSFTYNLMISGNNAVDTGYPSIRSDNSNLVLNPSSSGGLFLAWDTGGNINLGRGGTYVSQNGSITGNANAEFRADHSLATLGYVWINGAQIYLGSDNWLYCTASTRFYDLQSSNNINAAGFLQASNGVVYLNGMYWQNYGGYMYTPSPIHTDNYLNVAGCLVQNNSGWLYTPQPFLSNSDIAAQGVLRAGGTGGVYWQNNGGWMFTGNSFWANDVITCSSHCYPRSQGGCYSGLGSNSWAACYSYAYPGPSGRSMKTDIVDAPEGALEKVNALRVVHFRWREEVRPASDDANRLHHGFIADEAARALGEDFGGYYNFPEAETGGERLDKTEMVCVLWKAVQELTAKLAKLEAR